MGHWLNGLNGEYHGNDFFCLRSRISELDALYLNVFLQKNDLTVAEAKAVLNTDGTEGSDRDVSAVQSRLEEQQNEIQELKKTLAEQREEAEKQKQRADDLGNQLEEKVSAAAASHVNS